MQIYLFPEKTEVNRLKKELEKTTGLQIFLEKPSNL